jgi:single-strand DNA-binding protein
MPSFNKVLFMGNLTRDPELKYTPNEQAVCELGVAANRKYTVNGQPQEETTFVDVTVWNKQAESCEKYLSKGSPVFIEGRLKLDTWVNNEGQKRSKLRITAERVQFLPTGSQNQNTEGSREENPQPYNNNSNLNSVPPPPMPEPPDDIYQGNDDIVDDIPF